MSGHDEEHQPQLMNERCRCCEPTTNFTAEPTYLFTERDCRKIFEIGRLGPREPLYDTQDETREWREKTQKRNGMLKIMS